MNASPAEVLKQTSQEILTLWEQEVRKQIPAARRETPLSLRNSIPEFLHDLIRALETNFHQQSGDFLKFAHKHGRERANDSSYTIEDAITEYNILRRVIFSVLENKCEINSRDRDIIYEAISLALAKAGAEYAKTQIHDIQELHTRLNVALESAEIGLFSYDLKTGKVRWTERLARIYGLEPQATELDIHEAEKFYYPEDKDRIHTSLEEAIDNHAVFREQFRIIRNDGSIRWISSTGRPIYDENGVCTQVIGTNIDYTDSKLSRDIIKNLAERLQLITDIQPTMVIYMDPQLNYVFVNSTFGEWFKTDPKSVIGRNVSEMFPKEKFEELKDKIKEALDGKMVKFKHFVDYPAGRKFVDVTYKPHFNESGEVIGFFVYVEDRTEEKLIIDELRREQDLRDKFVSTLSHDLRTPLTASKMSAQIIARKITDPQIHTHTTRIVDNINRADKLIEDLLDAGRIRAGKLVIPETEEFDLVHLIHMTLEDLTTIHGERFKFTGPGRFMVNLHAEGIRRVLENLCTNAIKYGSSHDPVRIKISPKDDRFQLSVCNAGHPLIHVDKDKLFEPFEQAHPQHKGGWGIGLTIVKGITEAHGGRVHVESDGNTTFTVNLPVDARPYIAHQLH